MEESESEEENNASDDPDFVPTTSAPRNRPKYDIWKKKEIVDFWENKGGFRLKLSTVQTRYKYVSNLNILSQWRKRIYGNGGQYIITIYF